jgi:ankyrin repeat protein
MSLYRTITTTITQVLNKEKKDKILFAIVTGNLNQLKPLIDSTNINNIIDDVNEYTPLHYAVKLKFNDITKFLLDNGAEPYLLQGENKNCFELATDAHTSYIFEYFKLKQEQEVSKLKSEVTGLNKEINNLQDSNSFLNSTIDNYKNKVTRLNIIIEDKNKEIEDLKRKKEEADEAFSKLLKKFKK